MEPLQALRELHRVTESSGALLRESPERLQEALALVVSGLERLLPGRTIRLCEHVGVEAEITSIPLGEACLEIDGAPLDEKQALVAGVFAQQAAGLLEQARRLVQSRKDLQRKKNELTRLSRSALLISSRLSLAETLESILGTALEVTGADYGIFRLRDEASRHLVTAAVAGERLDRPLVEALPLSPSNIMGWVATHRKSVLIHDLHTEPWVSLYHPLDQVLEMRSELAVPLLGGGGRLEGVLNVESPEPGAFSQGDQVLLEAFANQAVITIQQVRLLDALQEIAERLLSWPCRRVLERLLELARHLLDAGSVAIWRQGRLYAFEGEEPRGDWGQVLEAPMRVGPDEAPLGLLSALYREPCGGEWDTKVLACLAHHAALAIESEQRHDQLLASQQQRAVAETFAAVGDLAANLLHQLNNKVGIIPVRIQGVEDKCRRAVSDDPYLARNLAEIRTSAQQAMRIVRDNLGVLRSGGQTRVDLAECVGQAIEELCPGEGLVVDRRQLAELPPVLGEQRSLVLIFWNLLDNANKAMEGQGELKLTGRLLSAGVEVRVTDDGPGIPPRLQEQVFELGSQETNGRSLGFGLWWVRTLMTRLGGSIAVESDGTSGTTFVLCFPRAEESS